MPDIKETLIALFKSYKCEFENCDKCPHPKIPGACSDYVWNGLADHMIANSVTVPPCKVGDTIFEADAEHGVVKHKVYEICVVYKTTATDDKGTEWDDFYTSDDIDTAYKSRQEAECALPEPPKGE